MKIKEWKPYLFFILLAEGVGLLAGLLTREATMLYSETIQKPAFSPPAILFPIVWTVLYGLMGIGAARIWNTSESADRKRALNIFIIQLVVNFFWSPIFFNAQAFGAALVWLVLLWVLVLQMILSFRRVDKAAALLQIPYLLWVTFAVYLNFGIWMLNG